MNEEMNPVEGPGAEGLGWGGFEFGRRLALQASGLIAATTGVAALVNASSAAAATNSSVIKIGYVSPQTGALADFAGPDNYVLQKVKASPSFHNGVTIGGKKYTFEIIVKDTQSQANVAVQVTQALIAAGVDIVLVTSAPETTIPVSLTCEAAKVPCVSTVVPWEAYWGAFTGNSIGTHGEAVGPGPKYNATFFFGIPQFVGCFVPMIKRIQATTNANSCFAEMFPNDADGNAFSAAWGPTVDAIFPNTFTYFKGQNGYTDLGGNWTAMAQAFKTGGPNGAQCDLFINCPLPPDFQAFWTVAAQQGWKPKLATVAKVMLFPADAYALGDLSLNVATDAWFTPYAPYHSSLDNQSAGSFAIGYQNTKGNPQWVQSMGSSYALFEVALAAIKKVTNPHNRQALGAAIQAVNLPMSMVGPINMNSKVANPLLASPAPGIAIIPPVGIQWKKGSKNLIGGRTYKYSPVVVDNTLNPMVPKNGTLEPTNK